MIYPELGPDFGQAENLKAIEIAEQLQLFQAGRRVYFIGIAGISMLGLAEMAAHRGLIVAGSDPAAETFSKRFQEHGILVHKSQESHQIDAFAPDFVVYSAAISAQNPELQRSRELALPCLTRAAFLGLINRQYSRVFNVAGTNGKTTTTALTAKLLIASGFDPTVHLGAEFAEFKGTIRLGGEPDLMVSEACEFSGSFLAFRSTDATILNIAHDHVDIFPALDNVVEIFLRFALALEPKGTLYLPTFAPEIPSFLERLLAIQADYFRDRRLFLYGYAKSLAEELGLPYCVDLSAVGSEILELKELFLSELHWAGAFASGKLSYLGDSQPFQLVIPGQFNLENALAATAMALGAGADFKKIAAALSDFYGAEGRFTYCGEFHGAKIIADYAHHADSLKLTIETALRMPHRRLHVYFQPITYSRAVANQQGFYEALKLADCGNLIEVYDNRESEHSFSTKKIAQDLLADGYKSHYFPSIEAAEAHARKVLESGDLALFIGASIRQVADRLAGRTQHETKERLDVD